MIKNDKSSNFNVLILKMYTSLSLNCLECFEGWRVLSSTDKHRSTKLDIMNVGMPLLHPDRASKDLPGRILGAGAGGAHPPPPRDDLRFSNSTGILQKKNYLVYWC